MSLDHILILVLLICSVCFQGIFTKKEILRKGVKPTDGEKLLKNLINNGGIKGKPEYLLFTAPYRLCQGGCQDGDDANLAMAFPVFVGKNMTSYYPKIYSKEKRGGDDGQGKDDGRGEHGERKVNLTDILGTKPSKQYYTTCAEVNAKQRELTRSTWYLGYSPSRGAYTPANAKSKIRIFKPRCKYRMNRKSLQSRNYGDFYDEPIHYKLNYNTVSRDSRRYIPSRITVTWRPVLQIVSPENNQRQYNVGPLMSFRPYRSYHR